FDLLRYSDISFEKLSEIWPELRAISEKNQEQIKIEAQYSGYIERQEADIQSFRRDEDLALPESLDYSQFSELSNEIKAKLGHIRPKTLGAAGRISGVTPASLIALLRYVKKNKNQARKKSA
ncbi:MAG: tRNA uridine-5-carboxymethylaminomethyl(34) synthesis enzyme MnmG, partial [Dongiaceae bacterium]